MKERFKITEKMTIGEVIQKYPKTSSVFLNYGFHCFGCSSAPIETIKEAAEVHQIKLKKFLRDLNKSVK